VAGELLPLLPLPQVVGRQVRVEVKPAHALGKAALLRGTGQQGGGPLGRARKG
jgi:hypothetical protein